MGVCVCETKLRDVIGHVILIESNIDTNCLIFLTQLFWSFGVKLKFNKSVNATKQQHISVNNTVESSHNTERGTEIANPIYSPEEKVAVMRK